MAKTFDFSRPTGERLKPVTPQVARIERAREFEIVCRDDLYRALSPDIRRASTADTSAPVAATAPTLKE